jgi:hypothetical protein
MAWVETDLAALAGWAEGMGVVCPFCHSIVPTEGWRHGTPQSGLQEVVPIGSPGGPALQKR